MKERARIFTINAAEENAGSLITMEINNFLKKFDENDNITVNDIDTVVSQNGVIVTTVWYTEDLDEGYDDDDDED